MDKNNLNIAMHVNNKFNRNRATRLSYLCETFISGVYRKKFSIVEFGHSFSALKKNRSPVNRSSFVSVIDFCKSIVVLGYSG